MPRYTENRAERKEQHTAKVTYDRERSKENDGRDEAKKEKEERSRIRSKVFVFQRTPANLRYPRSQPDYMQCLSGTESAILNRELGDSESCDSKVAAKH